MRLKSQQAAVEADKLQKKVDDLQHFSELERQVCRVPHTVQGFKLALTARALTLGSVLAARCADVISAVGFQHPNLHVLCGCSNWLRGRSA